MPTGRAAVDFTDIGYLAASFYADGSTIVYDVTQPNGAAATMIGKAVMLSAARTVALTSDGAAVIGKLLRVSADGVCTVQIEGFTTLPGGLSAALTLGKKIVGATGTAGARGYIRDVATATAAELGVCDHEIYDASDATAVVVELE